MSSAPEYQDVATLESGTSPEPVVPVLEPVVKLKQFPPWIVWGIVFLSVFPFLLNLTGVSFSSLAPPGTTENFPSKSILEAGFFSQYHLEGGYVFILWEWSAFCIALFTVIFSFAHFRVTRDTTTPIIGSALFFAAMIDAFRVLTFTGLINSDIKPEDFIPFTWVISRMLNVCWLIAGALPFLSGRTIPRHQHEERGLRFILLMGLLYGLMGYAIIHLCAILPALPPTLLPQNTFPRPWDVLPLVLYLFAGGIIFPRFHKAHPSLFSHGLLLSVIPHLACQAHAALGSSQLFDNDFNISLYLKTIAYLVPFAGLILDYIGAYSAEVVLVETQAKLRVAREVQKGLLPEQSPVFDNFDVAGISIAADAAGGDFFDYVSTDENNLGIVVADVSGHEVASSILMAETRAYMRATTDHLTDVGAIVTIVNNYLVDDVQGRWFVTLFFTRIDINTGVIKYAATGHDAYIFRTDGSTVNLESTGPPSGVMKVTEVSCGPEAVLGTGDLLLIYTDGLVEALSSEQEQFGFQRVEKIVQAEQSRPAHEIIQKLKESLIAFQESEHLEDDLTIVIAKRTK